MTKLSSDSKPKPEWSFDSKDAKNELKSNALRGAGTMVVSRIICQGIMVVSSITLARLLIPEDFGLVAMVTVFSGILLEFGSLRLSDATVQRPSLQQGQVSALFWINVVVGVSIGIVLALCGPLVALLYEEPRLSDICVAMALTFLLSGLSVQHWALMQRKMEFKRIAALDISATTFSVVVAISGAVAGVGYWALVLRRIAYQFALVVGTWILSRWRPGYPKFDEAVRSMLRFGINSLGSYTLTYFSRNLDKMLLGWRSGAIELGIYDRAYQIFVMPVYQLITPLSTVAVSTLSRITDDRERYGRYVTKSLRMMAFIGVPISACVTLTGSDVVMAVLGEKWAQAGPVLQVFGPGIVVMMMNGKNQWLHISLGRADRLLRWNLLRFLVTIPLLLFGLRYGAVGMAAAYVASFYLLTGPGLSYAGQPIGFKPHHCFWEISKLFTVGILSTIVTWALYYSGLRIQIIGVEPNPIIRTLLSSITVSIFYFMLSGMVLRGFGVHAEVLALVKAMLPKLVKKLKK